MKRIVCLLLAAMLVLGAVVAIADGVTVSASYENGQLSVSTSTKGYFEIYVDGNGTRQSLTPSKPSHTFSYSLDDGVHTVMINNDVHGSATTTVRVGAAPTAVPTEAPTAVPTAVPTEVPTAVPTAVPTEVPTAVPTEVPTVVPTEAPTAEAGPIKLSGTPSYQNGVITFTVNGVTGRSEAWVDGESAKFAFSTSGTFSFNKRLAQGKHTLTVMYSGNNEQDSRTFDVKYTQPVITAKYVEKGKLEFNVSKLNTRSEIWFDGVKTEISVSVDGSYVLNRELACESTHTLAVHDPANNLTSTTTVKVSHIAKAVEAVAPTCTEAGKTAGKVCALCGKVMEEQKEVPALGHDLVVDPAVAATCTEAGKEAGEHCSRCDYVKAGKVVPALGHDIVVDPAVAATCTEAGKEAGEHCSRCDYVKAGKVVPALGHDIVVDPAVAATCTVAGNEAGEHCSRCDYVKAGKVVPALGHDIVVDPAVAATCTEAGKEAGEHCSRCDYVKAGKVVPALGHDIVVDPAVAATCTEAGKEAGEHCSRCDYVKAGKEIPALGHDIVVDPAVEATCTEAGKEAGEHCSRCDYVKAGKEIPALGHKAEIIPAVEPTCLTTGLTEGEKCSVCGVVIKEQEEVKALGHNYIIIERTDDKVVYKCSRCGDSFTEKLAGTAAKDQKNGYGTIVKDANGVDVDYTANANMMDQTCLVIVADLNCKPDLTTELGLYLDEILVQQLIKEGYETVNFLNGDASIVITLADIDAKWFDTESLIWAYVFSTDPAAEEGVLVKVEALVSATEKVEAVEFTGVVLKTVNGDVEITANGIY